MAEPGTETLDKIALLADIPPADRRDLEKRCAWRHYGVSEQIIDRDSDSDSGDVYFIVSGEVRIVNYSYSGREVSYDDIGAGGFFGELAAIDGKPRSATVVTLKKTVVASLSPEAFREALLDHPRLALAIMQRLVAVIRGSTDRIMDLSTLGAYSRVYAELLRLARQSIDEDYGATIAKLPTHSALASRCGTTRETVARAISDLGKREICEKRGQGLYFPDLETLEDIVEGGAED